MSSSLPIVKQLDRSLGHIIGSDLPLLKKAKRFVIKSGGKRVRPLFHYYLVKMLGYEGKEWRDIGAVGELIHAASLLHDDVIDDSALRRNQPTFHSRYGNKASILSGDYLLACALEYINRLRHSHTILPIFTRAVKMLAFGELLQMQYENAKRMPEKIYERIILAKTACLFGCMAETASVLTSENRDYNHPQRDSYCRFGERMGRLFQLRDDYLDYFQDQKGLGKKPWQDWERGLFTWPLITLTKLLGIKDRRDLIKIFNDPKKRNSNHGKQIGKKFFAKTNLQVKLQQEIEKEIHALMSFLRRHPDSSYRYMLLNQLAALLVNDID